MNRKEIDSIVNEYRETELIKKAKIINSNNKQFTLIISTGQVVSTFTKLIEFKKFMKEIKGRNNE
jgi:hypothetical protein